VIVTGTSQTCDAKIFFLQGMKNIVTSTFSGGGTKATDPFLTTTPFLQLRPTYFYAT
jgi:hypothetical protein